MTALALVVSLIAMTGSIFVSISTYITGEYVLTFIFWYFLPLVFMALGCLIRGNKLSPSILVLALAGPVSIPVVTISIKGGYYE